MRRQLARAFVTTVSLGALVGCNKPTPPPEELSHNPPEPRPEPVATGAPTFGNPPPEPEPEPEATATPPESQGKDALRKRKRTGPASQAATTVRYPTKARVLNPKDDLGRVIYAASDDRCLVRARPAEPPRRGMGAPSMEQVACPPTLDDPAWDHCPARLVLDEDSGECACAPEFGNPPPPPRPAPCPAGTTKR